MVRLQTIAVSCIALMNTVPLSVATYVPLFREPPKPCPTDWKSNCPGVLPDILKSFNGITATVVEGLLDINNGGAVSQGGNSAQAGADVIDQACQQRVREDMQWDMESAGWTGFAASDLPPPITCTSALVLNTGQEHMPGKGPGWDVHVASTDGRSPGLPRLEARGVLASEKSTLVEDKVYNGTAPGIHVDAFGEVRFVSELLHLDSISPSTFQKVTTTSATTPAHKFHKRGHVETIVAGSPVADELTTTVVVDADSTLTVVQEQSTTTMTAAAEPVTTITAAKPPLGPTTTVVYMSATTTIAVLPTETDIGHRVTGLNMPQPYVQCMYENNNKGGVNLDTMTVDDFCGSKWESHVKSWWNGAVWWCVAANAREEVTKQHNEAAKYWFDLNCPNRLNKYMEQQWCLMIEKCPRSGC